MRYSIKELKGTPTIFCNGEPIYSWVGQFGLPQEKLVRDFEKNGLHVYHLYTRGFWEDPQNFLDLMKSVVRIDPKARFLVQIQLMAPTNLIKRNAFIAKWYSENPPGEKGENQVSLRKLRTRPDETKVFSEIASVASKKWLDYALPRYAAYVETLEKSEFGPRILGYWPCYHTV